MSLTRKFVLSIIASIIFIVVINLIAIYVFYNLYLKLYLYEKNKVKDNVTIEYINEVIKKQTIDNIDSIFSDTEIEFWELLETNEGKIPLDKEQNIDIVVNYLVKSGLAPKYIEEIIPTNNFQKVLDKLAEEDSAEAEFFSRFSYSIILTNFIGIIIISGLLFIFIGRTIRPINRTTQKIKNLNETSRIGNRTMEYFIDYKNTKDEIGLLVEAINNLNKKLSLQNDIRTRLLADISHELKTPITSIQCYLEGISDGVIRLDEKNITSIHSEMSRLISLVNKIMDYEKFDREKFKLHIEKFNVGDLLKNISETHKKRLSENKQRLKITGETNLEIQADKDLFSQLAHNLVGNFLKYAGKNTQLNIIINKKYIDFFDNGAGIKTKQIPYLTEKFYQGNTEKSGDIEKRGIGVGLSMVEKIIESHNWRYEIKSDVGKGFSFKIYIS